MYDAVLNRFAFHDPLADLATLAPQGVDEDCAAYVVAGWWSDPALDPLDKARSNDSLHELLDRLRWRLLYEWGDAAGSQQQDAAQAELRRALGLTTTDRWSGSRPVATAALRAAAARHALRADRQDLPRQAGARGGVGLRQRGDRALRRAALAACARRCCTARSTACR